MDIIGVSMKGIYRDMIKGKDNHIIFDSGWVSNTIVDRCRMLLAGLMKNDSSEGIQYLAVGQGEEAWDTAGTPAPEPITTGLVNPFDPMVQIRASDLVYLDENGEQTATPTKQLQITVTLEKDYPASTTYPFYPLREFGLFGRIGGQNYMINCVRHPVIRKDSSTTLIRVIRLYF